MCNSYKVIYFILYDCPEAFACLLFFSVCPISNIQKKKNMTVQREVGVIRKKEENEAVFLNLNKPFLEKTTTFFFT